MLTEGLVDGLDCSFIVVEGPRKRRPYLFAEVGCSYRIGFLRCLGVLDLGDLTLDN